MYIIKRDCLTDKNKRVMRVTAKQKIEKDITILEAWLSCNTTGNENEFVNKARERNVLINKLETARKEGIRRHNAHRVPSGVEVHAIPTRANITTVKSY